MRSLSLMSSRTAPCSLATSAAGAGGRSDGRGWRCPTGAGNGDDRTAASGPGGETAALSDELFWAQAVPNMAAPSPAAARRTARRFSTIDSRRKSSKWRANNTREEGWSPSSFGITPRFRPESGTAAATKYPWAGPRSAAFLATCATAAGDFDVLSINLRCSGE
jgi:hypothetical protein